MDSQRAAAPWMRAADENEDGAGGGDDERLTERAEDGLIMAEAWIICSCNALVRLIDRGAVW